MPTTASIFKALSALVDAVNHTMIYARTSWMLVAHPTFVAVWHPIARVEDTIHQTVHSAVNDAIVTLDNTHEPISK